MSIILNHQRFSYLVSLLIWNLLNVNWMKLSVWWKWLLAFTAIITGVWYNQHFHWIGVIEVSGDVENPVSKDNTNLTGGNAYLIDGDITVVDKVRVRVSQTQKLCSRQCLGFAISLMFYLSLVIYQSFLLFSLESVMWCVVCVCSWYFVCGGLFQKN